MSEALTKHLMPHSLVVSYNLPLSDFVSSPEDEIDSWLQTVQHISTDLPIRFRAIPQALLEVWDCSEKILYKAIISDLNTCRAISSVHPDSIPEEAFTHGTHGNTEWESVSYTR